MYVQGAVAAEVINGNVIHYKNWILSVWEEAPSVRALWRQAAAVTREDSGLSARTHSLVVTTNRQQRLIVNLALQEIQSHIAAN
jgi:hypothetical protein